MSARVKKKARLGVGTVYRDQIDMLDDYHAVHMREGRLRKVGPDVRTAPAPREVQFTSDSWCLASSWAPDDDPEYALDPDGEWYVGPVTGLQTRAGTRVWVGRVRVRVTPKVPAENPHPWPGCGGFLN